MLLLQIDFIRRFLKYFLGGIYFSLEQFLFLFGLLSPFYSNFGTGSIDTFMYTIHQK